MNDEPIGEEPKESTGLATVGGAAVVAIALIAFIVQNRDDAEVTWLFLDGTWPLWIVIVISAVAGAILSEVVGWLMRRRRRAKE
ncbi:MAG: LapA family protein [Actinomycetota bacterium]